MIKGGWLFTTAWMAFASPALAQDVAAVAPSAASTRETASQGEIIVTATRRNEALSDVPLAVSAVTGETLVQSGVSDIRQLNQLSPSLLVSSTTSEAGAGVARIRGIGTVGENPGLESAVGLFVDGVYRSRAGTALTELGAIDRIEVLRGPQGTLFGRNTSAGLIHVITAQPSFEESGTAELSRGNYDYWRATVGLTGPISETVAYRLDGVYVKRDGFIDEVLSGRSINDRDRWLVRGQLRLEPSDALSIRLIGDYADRSEECCASVYLPTRDVTRNADGSLSFGPSQVANLIRQFSGRPDAIQDDTFARRTMLTPGRDYTSDVRDWGLSGEINYSFGDTKLTSITAYRNWRYIRGQDSDYTVLDLLSREGDGGYTQSFKTFTQELRLQGEAFAGRLDWLVGAYYANENLGLTDNLRYRADYGPFFACLVASQIPGAFNPGAANCNGTPGLPQLGAAGPLIQSTLTRLAGINGEGAGVDRYKQNSRNYAFFTHNVFDITDRLSLTLGLRYTNERKTLDAEFNGSAAAASACRQNFAGLAPLLATASPVRGLAQIIYSLSCLPVAPIANGSLRDRKSEGQFTGTAVLSFKPTDDLLAYASYSKGYKAGGYNLDRSPLGGAASQGRPLSASLIRFAPEKVDAFEIGAKYNGRRIDVNVAAFYQLFDSFQLNSFTGTTFEVVNIEGCSELGNGPDADTDASDATGACTGKGKAGVVSKGIEVELFARPLPDVTTNFGVTVADTRFRDDLSGADGTPLRAALFQLPGRRLSNAPLYTVTGGASWTPPIGSAGLSGLLYGDFRYQSKINTGSDLDLEKEQPGVVVVNARIGVRGPEAAWAIELWAQNLFDADYRQTAYDAPLQPGGVFNTLRGVAGGYPGPTGNQLFQAFLAEPRTYGVTVRTKF